MGERIRRHLTYANVMATIAVFLVVGGGGAYAAKKLSKNAVKTKNIKNLAVTGPKLGNLAVTEPKLGNQAATNPKIGDKAVKTGKLGEKAVTTAKLEDGAVNAAKTDFIAKSGRIVSSPALNQAESPALLSIAGITVRGGCTDTGGAHDASFSIDGPVNSFYAGVQARDADTPDDVVSSLPSNVGDSADSGHGRAFTTLTVVTPSTAVHLDVLTAVNQQGASCVFSATASAG